MNYSQLDYDELQTLRAIGSGRFTHAHACAIENLPALLELSFCNLIRLTLDGMRVTAVTLTPQGQHWLLKCGPGAGDQAVHKPKDASG